MISPFIILNFYLKSIPKLGFSRGFVTLFDTSPSDPVGGCGAHYHDSRALDADFAPKPKPTSQNLCALGVLGGKKNPCKSAKSVVQVSFTGPNRPLTRDSGS